MARLEKFSGAQSLPGVGNPQVVADTAVGAATAGFGRQIRQSADEIGGLVDDAHKARQARLARLAREQQEQADRFAVVAAGLKLRRKLTGMQPEEQHKLRPGAIGHTEAMLAKLEKGAQRTSQGAAGNRTSRIRSRS
ncbi:hypothetical protein QW131_15255 [Roseibium salinum]|nr:hypothetical protein [Roseibium salinum]